MKLLFCADLHLGEYPYLGINKEGINQRLLDIMDSFSIIVDYALSKKVKYFFIVGDIFNTGNPKSIELNLFWQQASRLLYNKINLIIIIGNHDNKGSLIHVFESLKNLDKFLEKLTIIDKKQYYYIADNMPILVVPYNKDITKEDLRSMNCKILVGHFGINGAKMGPADYELRENKINMSFIRQNFEYAFLGHIHKAQTFYKDKKHFYGYCGSIDKINFGEENEKKRFLVFDTINKQVLSYIIPTRKFITIKWQNEIKENIKEAIVRVKAENVNEKEISDTINKKGGYLYKIVYSQKDIGKDDDLIESKYDSIIENFRDSMRRKKLINTKTHIMGERILKEVIK